MTRKNNGQAFALASWYCQTVLGRPYQSLNDGQILGNATLALKMAKELGGHIVHVQHLVLSLHLGQCEAIGYRTWATWAALKHFATPVALFHLWKTSPEGRTDVTLLQWALSIPEPPAVHDFVAFADWIEKHGRRALDTGKWDGTVPWQPFVKPEETVMPPSRVIALLGESALDRSMKTLSYMESMYGHKS